VIPHYGKLLGFSGISGKIFIGITPALQGLHGVIRHTGRGYAAVGARAGHSWRAVPNSGWHQGDSFPMTDLLDYFDESFGNPWESPPYLDECNGTVRLHFKAFDIQSSMYRHAPHELVLSYTQTMMDAFCFNEHPETVGMIGLGGGSMQKACYQRFPNAIISVAEINPRVIALRDQFLIPKDDERFVVYCEDGADFVRRQPGHFDVLVVDGFDKKGQPAQLCSQQFYCDCHNALTADGLLIVNLLSGSHRLVTRIRRSFENEVILADGDAESANTIVIAGKGNRLATARWPPSREKAAPPFRVK
jgi:spermidine synthase